MPVEEEPPGATGPDFKVYDLGPLHFYVRVNSEEHPNDKKMGVKILNDVLVITKNFFL